MLGVYTYDSLAGKGGLGPEIFPLFEKKSGCRIQVFTSGDASQLVSRIALDRKRGKVSGDVVLGVDVLFWDKIRPNVDSGMTLDSNVRKLLYPFISGQLREREGFIPYNWGALALIVDQESLQKAGLHPPKTLEDLARPELKKSFILEDPRTSSPGLQFLLFSRSQLGSGFKRYWTQMSGQWLTMPPGWDSAYSLFLRGAAPLVWSYVTSEAYHREKGMTRYRAVLFQEGQPVQIEGAVRLKNAAHPKAAGEFLKFLLSSEVQDRVGEVNWMWPVVKKAKVPKSFSVLPNPQKLILLSGEEAEGALQEWSEAVHP